MDNDKPGGKRKQNRKGRRGKTPRYRQIKQISIVRHNSDEARGPGDNVHVSEHKNDSREKADKLIYEKYIN